MDAIDRKLLDHLQAGLPLIRRPFEAIAQRVGISEDATLRRLAMLRGDGGVIRQISAIFDSRSLGYRSCLVGAKVDESRITDAAAMINRHPGVSHNYRREHVYNLWYTVAVPPDSALGLERTVQLLHEQSGARVTRLMPTIRMYKIGVRFDLSGNGVGVNGSPAPARVEPARAFTPSSVDRQAIRVLQEDLPTETQPFDALAASLELPVERLLEMAEQYREMGIMRRFAAVLRHRAAGFGANAMGAWIVPPPHQDDFGATAARFTAVSHCYLRPTYDDWPYSVFTMVHGRSPDDCQQTLAQIAAATGIRDYAALFSTHEYKKTRVRYFTDEIAEWESEPGWKGRGGIRTRE